MSRIVVVMGPRRDDESLADGLTARPGPVWDRVDRYEDAHARFLVGTFRTTTVDAQASALHVDDELVVAFDGLLTNRAELLRATDARANSSQAELVAHAFRRYARELPRLLSGEFALVIHRRGDRGIFAAVDPFATRMLHHAHAGDRLVLCTEPRGCRRALGLPLRPNLKILVNTIAGFPVTRDTSLYEGVRHLGAGTSLVWSGGTVTLAEVSTPEISEAERDVDRMALDRVEDALAEATRARVVATDRVGVLASGGLDSTVITALATRAARENGKPDPVLFHFSAGQHEADESPLARRLSEQLGLDLHVFHAREPRLPRMHALHEFAGASTIVYREMFQRAASLGIRVLLTGEGSDDPQSPSGFECEDALGRRDLRNALAFAGLHARPFAPSSWRRLGRALVLPVIPRAVIEARGWRRVQANIPRWVTARGVELVREAIADRDRFERAADRGSRHRCKLFTNLVWNPSTTLTNQIPNLFAAENGIETRHPFYDSKPFSLMARLPVDVLHRPGEQKPFTRRLAARLVTGELAYRRTPTDYGDFHLQSFSHVEAWKTLLREGRLFDLGVVDRAAFLAEMEGGSGPVSYEQQVSALAEDWLWSLEQR